MMLPAANLHPTVSCWQPNSFVWTARVLVVEDAPAGVAAAHAAGRAVLGIASTKEPAELAADAVVADPSGIQWRVTDDGANALEIRAP